MILQKTEVMLCVCLFCFVFTGKLDCLFCIFAWWIIVLTVLMRFLFSFFFSGRFFKLNGDLPAIYCDKNPQVVFILFFSARSKFCFWSVMLLRFDEFFFHPAQCTWKCFFFFFYSGTSENGSTVFKTGNDIYDFSSDEQQCRFKERFRIHLVAQL